MKAGFQDSPSIFPSEYYLEFYRIKLFMLRIEQKKDVAVFIMPKSNLQFQSPRSHWV